MLQHETIIQSVSSRFLYFGENAVNIWLILFIDGDNANALKVFDKHEITLLHLNTKGYNNLV